MALKGEEKVHTKEVVVVARVVVLVVVEVEVGVVTDLAQLHLDVVEAAHPQLARLATELGRRRRASRAPPRRTRW